MDNSLKGLLIAAGVIITCIVIGLGFYVSREAKNTSNNGTSQVSSMNSEYQDVELALYDGLQVSGREVVNKINNFDFTSIKDFKITVKTLDGTKEYKTNVYNIAKGATNYINPTAQFLGSISKDSNNIISELIFTQQK